MNTIDRIEKEYLSLDKNDISGTCALICIIADNKIYFCNVGDSRAI